MPQEYRTFDRITLYYMIYPCMLTNFYENYKSLFTFIYFYGIVLQMQELTDQILQKHSESLSKLVLPSEIVQTLYTEGIFSNETFDEVTKLRGSLSGGPLRALSNTVSKDFKQLRLFVMVLLQSEDTVGIANDILNEYGKWFYFIIVLYLMYIQIRLKYQYSHKVNQVFYMIHYSMDKCCLTTNSS